MVKSANVTSVEDKVEDYYKALLNDLGIRTYGKTEIMNVDIYEALKSYSSKAGGSGGNIPDIRLLLEDNHSRRIPVMIEAKGTKGKLEKLTSNGEIELENKEKKISSAVQAYAINGALHYGLALLECSGYDEVIVVGINGTTLVDSKIADPEHKAYYVAKKNSKIPKEIVGFDFVQMKKENLDNFYALLDTMLLSATELEELKRKKEELLERSIKDIHQKIYEDTEIRTLLGTSEKLYFFCGLIMAGLTTQGVSALHYTDLQGNTTEDDNDGETIIRRVKSFLKYKNCSEDKRNMVVSRLSPVFKKHDIWKPINGMSLIKTLYKQVEEDIIPLLESNLHLDFTGRILNSLNDWVQVENDKYNDVVLTPRYVTNLMARITRTNRNSFVWDTCMGSSGFLVSAMDFMIADAKANIPDKEEQKKKIENIHRNQLLGIEILGNIYILAVLNMILMGDGSSQVICGDSHKVAPEFHKAHTDDFPANVFLLNPPYSAPGKGLIFVDEALSMMETGYGAVLIQENAGSGQGDVYSKRLLEKNRLVASIHMPNDLFRGKASPSNRHLSVRG